MATLAPVSASSAGASTDSAAQNHSAKLHSAAQQFEALMIGEMLKAAHSDDSDDALGGSDDDSGGDSTMQMAQSQLSSALAAHGGFGLAAMIEKSMSRATSSNQQATEIVGSPGAASPK